MYYPSKVPAGIEFIFSGREGAELVSSLLDATLCFSTTLFSATTTSPRADCVRGCVNDSLLEEGDGRDGRGYTHPMIQRQTSWEGGTRGQAARPDQAEAGGSS